MSGFDWDEPVIVRREPGPSEPSTSEDVWEGIGRQIDAEAALVGALREAKPIASLICGGDGGACGRRLARIVKTPLGFVATDRPVRADGRRLDAEGFVVVDEGSGEFHPELLRDGRSLTVWCRDHGLWNADLGALADGRTPSKRVVPLVPPT